MQDIVLFMQQHLVLVSLLTFILLLLLILEFIKLKRGARKLTPHQTVQLINHQKAMVLDVRNYESFQAGHVVNAISLPINELQDKIKKIEKFKSQPIVIVCATGVEALPAEKLLLQQGFQVHVLSGGIRAWRNAEMPLVKG
jgi:rhodanese-related sulfurtransferase